MPACRANQAAACRGHAATGLRGIGQPTHDARAGWTEGFPGRDQRTPPHARRLRKETPMTTTTIIGATIIGSTTGLMNWLTPGAMHSLGWALLHFVWQGTALAAVAAA